MFAFMGRTPEVFWFPLLFCTTPTFAGAVFELRFEFTFAELLFGAVVPLQPARPTTASRHIPIKVRFILILPSRRCLAINFFAAILLPVFLEVSSVFRIAWCYTHHDSAVLDSFFVFLDAFLRYA